MSLRGGLVSIQLQVKTIHRRDTHMEAVLLQTSASLGRPGAPHPTPTAGTPEAPRPQPENVKGPGKGRGQRRRLRGPESHCGVGTTVEVHRVGLASEGLGQEGDVVRAPLGGLGDPSRESREPDH